MTLEEYLKDPCKVSSLPFKKAKLYPPPEGISLVHGTPSDRFSEDGYFRLLHSLKNISRPVLPEEFALGEADATLLQRHINSCYRDLSVTEEQLASYEKAMTVVIAEAATGCIVASGIGEIDAEVREGYLEWIQVSPEYRRKGLGTFMVKELLWRMKDGVDFVTVSGKMHDESNPEVLYRACGFTGDDVWYLVREVSHS